MPESVVPLIAVGVVIVLFIVLLSVLTNNYSLNGIKSKTVDSTEPRAGRPRRRSKNRMPACRLMLQAGARERTCRRYRE